MFKNYSFVNEQFFFIMVEEISGVLGRYIISHKEEKDKKIKKKIVTIECTKEDDQ